MSFQEFSSVFVNNFFLLMFEVSLDITSFAFCHIFIVNEFILSTEITSYFAVPLHLPVHHSSKIQFLC